MCNVGTRFLFDIENGKASVQLVKTLAVAARFGIRLSVVKQESTKNSQELPTQAMRELVYQAPPYDPGHWIAARIIASSAARANGIPISDHRYAMASNTITVIEPATYATLLQSKGSPPLREEEGGPGLAQVFSAIDRVSGRPMADIKSLLEWVIFSYLIGDTMVGAADVRCHKIDGVWRLAPFSLLACTPSLVAKENAYQGLRIGREWPTDWLRTDHWIMLAQFAHVRPKVVFAMMQHMADIAPKAISDAAVCHYKMSTFRGAAALMLKTVTTRSTRMKELLLAAGYQGVAGIQKPTHVEKGSITEFDAPYMGHETLYE